MIYFNEEEIKVDLLPFIHRDVQDQLNSALNNQFSQSIIICGESGTGKTSLVREKVKEIILSPYKDNYLIFSINLIDDNITPSSFFEILIYTLWNGDIFDIDNMLNIAKSDSMSSFLKSKIHLRKLAKNLLYAVQSTISLIPTYGAALSNYTLETNNQIQNYTNINKTEVIEKYFFRICKKKKVIFIVDNYQFMIPSVKLLLENCIGRNENNFTFITIYRANIEDICKPLCFAQNKSLFIINNFSKLEVEKIFSKKYSDLEYFKKIANDCFNKTRGNAKEVELFIRQNDDDIRNHSFRKGKTKSLSELLCQLPDIQRYLLLLATLFPSGIKVEYIYRFVNKIFIVGSKDIEYELTKLVTLGYIVLNSVNNDLMKPSHDKIGLNLVRIKSDEDFLEFYTSIEKTLEELVFEGVRNEDYVYFLHCLIGVCSIHDLIRNINWFIELIGIKYTNCSYYYIIELIKEIDDYNELIKYLPEYTIIQVLDSCQKSSEFALGLSIYNQWNKQQAVNKDNQLNIYAVKFLTQMYDFEQALSIIKELNINNEILLYKLNILQHMGLDKTAKCIIDDLLESDCIKDKWYYLILRNSAHYYNYTDAFDNLTKCKSFFNKSGTIFEQATTYNNLSVIQIWNGTDTYVQAEKNLIESINKHKSINSNEIFEPYCNYSVLRFIQGDLNDALKYINLALDELPSRLELDVIILTINKLIYEYSSEKITLHSLYLSLREFYNKPIINKDPWVKFQVEFNLYNVEMQLLGSTSISFDEYYINKDVNTTGFEVFTKINRAGIEIPISLSLSPNWRY